MIRKYTEIFCWKNVSSFCSAKAAHIFSAKNIRILYIESAKIVNGMTLNELVKLMTLWTTGPWFAIANGQILSIFDRDSGRVLLFHIFIYFLLSCRTKKILSFVQTVAGVHVHTVQPNKIQIHFLKGNEELKLVLTLTLKDDNQGNPVLCDVKVGWIL